MRKFLLSAFIGILLSNTLSAQQDSVYILDLQECVRIALENNLIVRRSTLQKENARINLDQSRASQLPSVNLGGSYGFNWGRSIDPTTNQFISQQIGFTGLNGNAGMVVFNWFRLANTVKQNRLLLESAQYDAKKAENDLSLNIVTFYLNVIFNKELVENAEYQLESGQNQLDRTKKLVASGALPRTNELELISQVASSEVNLINTQNNLDLALLSLKQAMMLPSTQAIDIVIPELEVGGDFSSLSPVNAVYESALKNMPEIESAELQAKGAALGIDVARSGYTPTLSLNAGFSTNYSDAFQTFNIDPNNPLTIDRDDNGNIITEPTLFQTTTGTAIEQISVTPNGTLETVGFNTQFKNNLSKQLSLNLSIPIFNNLRTNSNVQRQKIALSQAEINVQEQKNTLRRIVESAHYDAQAASKVYSASERQVEALEETYRSIENQYNLGAANFTDYQVASNNLFGARSDLVRAKYDYIFKVKILDFYQGKTLSF
ncbi:MAG: TolC family protein [Cyclobacteriaceae bacterium]